MSRLSLFTSTVLLIGLSTMVSHHLSTMACHFSPRQDRIASQSQGKDLLLESLVNKLTALEEKLEHQEQQLRNLTERLSAAEKKSNESSLDHRNQRTIYRTCHEARAADSTLKSGMHWIDPNGKDVGNDPIRVHCNMTTGVTSIAHDSELETDVGRCAKRGCYSKEIKYDASDRQIAALAELSTHCQQSIKYNCVNAPLNFNGVAYAWWNDRNGNVRYIWSGNDSSVQQTVCQCGIDGDCFDDLLSCNCNSVLPTQLSDSGILTDKNILPVTRLNYGRIVHPSSSGAYTLGHFECSGQATVNNSANGMPQSCADLWRIGHKLSGLHLIMGPEKVETVFCDFSVPLPISDPSFQKWIGFNDVKSQPVYFYVQHNTKGFNTMNTPIPFQVARLNIGNAMDLESGKFTAPRPGIYHFAFKGFAQLLPANSKTLNRVLFSASIYLNGILIGTGEANAVERFYVHDSVSFHSTLSLKTGDQIWLQISQMTPGAYLYDDSAHHTHFSGWLLEENFSQPFDV